MFHADAVPIASYRASRRQRLFSMLTAAAGVALLLFLLSRLIAPYVTVKPRAPDTVGFEMSPEGTEKAPAEKAKTAKASRAARRDSPRPVTKPVPSKPPEPPVEPTPVPSANIIWLTRRQYAGTDVSRIPRGPPDDSADDASGGGDGRQAGPDSALSGQRGPNGEPVYAAEWVVEPTDAQLSTYLPPGFRGEGWGLIICRTAAGHRVEDCRELGDSPAGSRLAGAVRQAAWQFRVRAPRVGGREQVGTWVSIRITYRRRAG